MPEGMITCDGELNENRQAHIHPAWLSFIKFCKTLGFGEIERLKIQDGLPMLAEEVKRKIKFPSQR